MQITKKDIQDIAALSRLGLTDEELVTAVDNLANILEHFAQVQTIDTADIPPYENATNLTNITREDEPAGQALCTTEELLDRAPQTDQQHIKVPSVFKE